MNFKKQFFIGFICLTINLGCSKNINEKQIPLDNSKVFNKIKVKHVFTKSFELEICSVPTKKGIIIGEQKGAQGKLTYYNYDGNLINQKEITHNNTPNNIKSFFGCYLNEKDSKIYCVSRPFIKEFNPDTFDIKTLFRTYHRSSELNSGLGLTINHLMRIPGKLVFRYKDYSDSGSSGILFGIGITDIDFKNWKVLKSVKKSNLSDCFSIDKKTYLYNPYLEKDNHHFPFTIDPQYKEIYYISNIWESTIHKINLNGEETKYTFNLPKKPLDTEGTNALKAKLRWYKAEVMGTRYCKRFKKFRIKQTNNYPCFVHMLTYKDYLLAFSGAVNWKENTTTVYIFQKNTLHFLGTTSMPYSSNDANYIYNNYYVVHSIEENELGLYSYNVNLYQLGEK